MEDIDEMTVEETFEKMPDYFLKDEAEGLEGLVQFNIVGDSGGEWYVEITNCECKVTKGLHQNPSTVISTSVETWLEICKGELGGMEAFSEGKLSVNGDVAFVMSLDEVFEKADRDL